MSRQHHGGSGWDLVDVVHEHDPQPLEAVHHQLVVDDLVVAVDGLVEGPDHPGQRLDGHLHPGAEPPRGAQQNPVDAHGAQGTQPLVPIL